MYNMMLNMDILYYSVIYYITMYKMVLNLYKSDLVAKRFACVAAGKIHNNPKSI